ncbi:MAG: hypothetical protein FWE51_04930 [Coriobacteriia bacterium]|nr:hypothetical protein [Coriobacteriia bacterium]
MEEQLIASPMISPFAEFLVLILVVLIIATPVVITLLIARHFWKKHIKDRLSK